MWKFKPILKQTIWGGNRIAAFKGESTDASPSAHIGETYELSGMPGNESIVAEGPQAGQTLGDLIKERGEALLGRHNVERTGFTFPLLIKFLDVSDDLSVQVHPDDRMASRMNLPNGKSELWYVVHAEPHARLCAGFSTPLTSEEYKEAVAAGAITDHLCYTPVSRGDVYYIPAGTVHSLGKGCLVLEVQQPSETTYRIFDFNRRDKQGNLRELHTEEAFEALDLKRCGGAQVLYPDERETPSGLLSTAHFTVNRMHLSYRHTRDYKDIDSFKVLVVVDGCADIADTEGTLTARTGTVILISADQKKVTVTPAPEAEIIEIYV